MVQITVTCRHCGSDRLVRNGHADNGKQRYLCHACGKQSRESPHSRDLSPDRRAEILRAYQERQSMRGVARTFKVSRNTLAELVKGGTTAPSLGGDADPPRPLLSGVSPDDDPGTG